MKKRHISLLVLPALLLLFAKCQKEHPETEVHDPHLSQVFFVYSPQGEKTEKDSFTLYAIDALKNYENRQHFVKNFVNKTGFADWENSRYFRTGKECVLQTPCI